ncbi:hypothetical protein DERP_009298 [Dermatophagoides pteronyssinus]|uniref:Uncharacterized protein n=1 Tax=Dermatophagoides pteronyssinus TaxID=6956 RepID=A0ABQ8ITM6_DERPT|nr:hypothetical protein DERP_009298 [Dermatophagoides pteronyssinus]
MVVVVFGVVAINLKTYQFLKHSHRIGSGLDCVLDKKKIGYYIIKRRRVSWVGGYHHHHRLRSLTNLIFPSFFYSQNRHRLARNKRPIKICSKLNRNIHSIQQQQQH